MNLQTKLFLILVFIAILSGIWGYNTTASYITITDDAEHVIATLEASDEKTALDHAITEYDTILTGINQSEVLFTIEYTHPLWGKSDYYIYELNDARVVAGDGQTSYQPSDQIYFYTTAYFESIYDDRLPQSLIITIEGTESDLTYSSADWQIQKYDGKWYPYVPVIMEIFRDFNVTSPDQGVSLQFDQALNEPDDIVITFSDDYSQQISDVTAEKKDGQLIIENPDIETSGTYTILTTWHDDTAPYHGNATYMFHVTYDYPAVLTLASDTVKQGEPVAVYCNYANAAELESFNQTVSDMPSKWFDTSQGQLIYLPTTYNSEVGIYDISNNTQTIQVNVVSRDFNVQHLQISESIQTSTKNAEASAEFDEKFTPIRETSADDDLTDGAFILPITGRLSTEYGETRDVNGSPTTYRHSGWDLAAPTGTEIHATNRGKVVFAEALTLTGNTIVIDHGNGVFSTYFHMNILNVSAGQTVAKGEVIGQVGTTGFSTGPHLHFILSIYDQNIEPGYFIYGKAMTYSNYANLMYQ